MKVLRAPNNTVYLFLLALLLTGCASTGDPSVPAANDQDTAIAKWQLCLDRNLVELDVNQNPPHQVINAMLIACQGHKQDVLDTFPAHMEKSLGRIMVNQAYQSGVEEIALRRGLFSSPPGKVLRALVLDTSQ